MMANKLKKCLKNGLQEQLVMRALTLFTCVQKALLDLVAVAFAKVYYVAPFSVTTFLKQLLGYRVVIFD